MKPLIKWVGGKRGLVAELAESWDEEEGYDRLIEPFAGAAAFFFKVEAQKAILGDTCVPLTDYMTAVRNQPAKFIRSFSALEAQMPKGLKKQAQWYYELRDEFNEGKAKGYRQQALFLMLNRLCFHGLWRVNKKGEMNAAFGHYAKPKIPTPEEIKEVSAQLKNATIYSGDFRDTFKKAKPKKGDLIYCDPPYLDSYDGYTQTEFTIEDHKELADLLWKASTRGAACITTNKDCREIHRLYPKKKWEHIELNIRQKIAPHNGGKKPEIALVARAA